jgi:hypothetical protein
MEPNTVVEPAMLVNFRAPKDVIDTLDRLSRFHHRTRTSILLDLINNWINEKTYDVPLKVRQLSDLKLSLISHEQSAYGNRRSVGTGLIEKTSRNGSELIPVTFYSTSTTAFVEEENGRF